MDRSHPFARALAPIRGLGQRLDLAAKSLHETARGKASKAQADGATGAVPNVHDPAQVTRILEDLNAALRYGDEKVDIAVQTYELVDKHIRQVRAAVVVIGSRWDCISTRACVEGKKGGGGVLDVLCAFVELACYPSLANICIYIYLI